METKDVKDFTSEELGLMLPERFALIMKNQDEIRLIIDELARRKEQHAADTGGD